MPLIECLKRELTSIEEAITYEELNDRAYTRHYAILLRKKRILKGTIKKWESVERRASK